MTSVEALPCMEDSEQAGVGAARVESSSPAKPEDEMSGLDYKVLGVESQEWTTPGQKNRFMRSELGLTPTRYYQVLNRLLDDPRAEAHNPLLVRRLRRERDRCVERWR